jgi:hypothetical protein
MFDKTLMKKIIIVLCFLALPLGVYGHGDEASFEKLIGGELVDIGYSIGSAPDVLRLDFALYEDDTKEEVPFDNVWVNISNERQLLFAGPIAYGEFGKPGFSVYVAEPAEYSVSARFEKADDSTVEVTFPLQIKGNSPSAASSKSQVIWALGIMIAVIAAFMVGKKI